MNPGHSNAGIKFKMHLFTPFPLLCPSYVAVFKAYNIPYREAKYCPDVPLLTMKYHLEKTTFFSERWVIIDLSILVNNFT
jgi:hypothetical protein